MSISEEDLGALEQELFHTFEIPDDIEDEPDEPIEYGVSFYFDLDVGDFPISSGRPIEIDGYHAWVQWMAKAAITQRFAHLVYTDDYGIEIDEIHGAATRAEAENVAEETIRAALLDDDRTGDLYDFEFAWEGDSLTVTFTAEPAIGTTARVSIDIT